MIRTKLVVSLLFALLLVPTAAQSGSLSKEEISAAIAAEEAARIAADYSEAKYRVEEDQALKLKIVAEETSRIAADAELQSNIDAEAATRTAADSAETTARKDADALEESYRSTADDSIRESINNLGINLLDQITTLQEDLLAAESRINVLETKVAALDPSGVLSYLFIETGEINGLTGPHLIIVGANVHVRSGSGATDEGEFPTGLGNLVIGYNEEPLTPDRTGSHNLILGSENNYSSYGGLIAGYRNTISGLYSSVSGGQANTASGRIASVSGGQANTASGIYSSVSGGLSNTASNNSSSVSGGQANTASGGTSSVSGGSYNAASSGSSSVSGGSYNAASGGTSSVSGGSYNTASGIYSSVSGGSYNAASHDYSSVSGGYSQTTSTSYEWQPQTP